MGATWSERALMEQTRDVLLAGMFYLGDLTIMDPETVLISVPKEHFMAWIAEARETLDRLETTLDPELSETNRVSRITIRPSGAHVPESGVGPSNSGPYVFPVTNGPADL